MFVGTLFSSLDFSCFPEFFKYVRMMSLVSMGSSISCICLVYGPFGHESDSLILDVIAAG